MAMQLRYMGEFLSRASVTWRVEILQESDTSFDVGDLSFDAGEPLVIEWDTKDKEEPICGSTATVKVISPGDRTYEDLYSIEVGKIRLDVYREGSLYWSGALDPEFYEEPYEMAKEYTVELTFSDFGILDRLKYDLSGMQTLESILLYALGKSVINYEELDYSTFSSTYFSDGTKADLSSLSIRSENFFDEDGEASTLEEAIEGFLQPLGLRMIQKSGKIWVYDLNGLYNSGEQRLIEWDGDSQTMGVDKVANNVKINFSPYSSSTLLDTDVEYTDDYSVEAVNLENTNPNDEYGEYYSYYPDYSIKSDKEKDYNNVNFTIFISSNGKGLESLHTRARYFHICPQVGSAEESDGIVWGFYTGGHGELKSGYPVQKMNATSSAEQGVLMQTKRVFIPKLSESDAANYYLRLSMEMMLDPRYNPFSESGTENEKGNYERFKEYTGWAFIPATLTLYDENGNAILHYSNESVAKGGIKGSRSAIALSYDTNKWLSGEASYGEFFLEWYSTSDQKDDTGILGWQTNRHCIGRNDGVGDREDNYLYDSFTAMDAGQYIPYPSEGGWLEIKIYTGVFCYDYGEKGDWGDTVEWSDRGMYDLVRWMLYKAPKLEIVRNNIVFDEAELDDVEYSGYINKAAKEEISIDTVCGTSNKVCPTAKGIFHRASDSLQVQELSRAGVTDHPEKLFIGTLYSQYAERKTVLSGDAILDYGGLCTYTENNQSGKLFLMQGEVQDVITDDSEITIVEFRPDEYESIEEVS